MKCVKVPLKQTNTTRMKLMENGMMSMDFRIKTDNEFGYIPINGEVEGYEIVDIELDNIGTMCTLPENGVLGNDVIVSQIKKLKVENGSGRVSVYNLQ